MNIFQFTRQGRETCSGSLKEEPEFKCYKYPSRDAGGLLPARVCFCNTSSRMAPNPGRGPGAPPRPAAKSGHSGRKPRHLRLRPKPARGAGQRASPRRPARLRIPLRSDGPRPRPRSRSRGRGRGPHGRFAKVSVCHRGARSSAADTSLRSRRQPLAWSVRPRADPTGGPRSRTAAPVRPRGARLRRKGAGRGRRGETRGARGGSSRPARSRAFPARSPAPCVRGLARPAAMLDRAAAAAGGGLAEWGV